MIALLLHLACHSGTDTGPALGTGWFEDSGEDNPVTCPHQILDFTPVSGEEGWYYRAPLELWTASDRAEFYGFTLIDSHEAEVQLVRNWEGPHLSATPVKPLSPSEDYTLILGDCAQTREVPFRTSALGSPLSGGPSALLGRSYLIDFGDAEWAEPAGFGALMALYFTVPVLLGVSWADVEMVDLMGAQGYTDTTGAVHQSVGMPTWDYPIASFADAPWFFSEAEVASLSFDEVQVPVYGFSLEGSFSADGSQVGGAIVRGSADTQDMGVLIGRGGEPDAICALAASMGVSCVSCPDASPYCLDLHITALRGVELPGLSLSHVE